MQQLLDTALDQASPAARARFNQLLAGCADLATASDPMPALPFQQISTSQDDAAAEAEQRLFTDPHINAALDWLDLAAGLQPGASRRQVASQLARLNVGDVHRSQRSP